MAGPLSNSPAGSGPSDPDAGRSRFFGRRTALKSPNEALQPEAAPPPPAPVLRKKRGFSGIGALSTGLSLFLVLTVAAGYAFVVAERQLRAPGPLLNDKVVVIPTKTDVPEIIGHLEAEHVIDNPWLMTGVLWVEGTRGKLKAGEYMFKQNVSLRETIDILVAGRSILHAFTIPEGWTSEQIVGRLREQDLLESDLRDVPKEGTLMPETYKFVRGETRVKQIEKMQDAQKKVLAEVWAKRAPDLPLKSPFELVTLASIVEKETGKAEERPRVAGVFINRLVKGMRLQSDPTIVYGLVGGKGSLGRPITRADLNKTPNPYNTYQIPGLPPGPIANPGRAALEAVANPLRTQELYFVADGTGGHVFAETLQQHNSNVQRWRQIEQDGKDRLAPDATDKPVNGSKPPDQHGERIPRTTKPSSPALAFAATDEPMSPAAKAALRVAETLSGDASKPDPAAETALPAAKMDPADLWIKFSMGPSLDELGIKIRGVNDEPAAVAGIDNGWDDAQAGAGGDLNAYPASPARRAELRARAAKYGFGVAPDGPLDASPELTYVPTRPVAPGALGGPTRARAFDASEGTAFDPLKDHSFDLSSSKTVPAPVRPDQLVKFRAFDARPPAAVALLRHHAAEPVVGVSPVMAAANQPTGRPIFDASEGTALDPLRDQSYDLNSSKSPPPPITPAQMARAEVIRHAERGPALAARAATAETQSTGPAPAQKLGPAVFDASEGTALDPLRDHSYDLNSSKTLPAMVAPGQTARARNFDADEPKTAHRILAIDFKSSEALLPPQRTAPRSDERIAPSAISAPLPPKRPVVASLDPAIGLPPADSAHPAIEAAAPTPPRRPVFASLESAPVEPVRAAPPKRIMAPIPPRAAAMKPAKDRVALAPEPEKLSSPAPEPESTGREAPGFSVGVAPEASFVAGLDAAPQRGASNAAPSRKKPGKFAAANPSAPSLGRSASFDLYSSMAVPAIR